jgi:hypothetical protein
MGRIAPGGVRAPLTGQGLFLELPLGLATSATRSPQCKRQKAVSRDLYAGAVSALSAKSAASAQTLGQCGQPERQFPPPASRPIWAAEPRACSTMRECSTPLEELERRECSTRLAALIRARVESELLGPSLPLDEF